MSNKLYIIYTVYNIVKEYKKMGHFGLDRGFSLALTVGSSR